MAAALSDAEAAGRCGEVPIGAVVVIDGRIVGRGGNATEALQELTGELLHQRPEAWRWWFDQQPQ